MGSTFSGLSIGISGLYASQRALDTISHNIANADNSQYVRQQAIHADSRYTRISQRDYSGTGVDVQQIRQIRDEFLDLKIRREATEFGYWYSKSNVFSQIEAVLGELSEDGLQGVIDEFWGTWEEVAKDPSSLTARALLKERAVEFVGSVNHIYSQLESLQFNLDTNVRNMVGEINQLTENIADLNSKIVAYEAMGDKANDFRDTRNAYLDRLSQIIDIDYYTSASGSINVILGGTHLISDGNYRELEAKNNGNPFVDVHWKDTGDLLIEEKDIKGGELLGLLQARGSFGQESSITDPTEYKYVIPTIKRQLNEYVKGLAEAVNELHVAGHTLSGNPSEVFFEQKDTSKPGVWAGNIKLNDNLDSLNEIAAASNPGEVGNGKIAELIASLREGAFYENGNAVGITFDTVTLDITFLGKTTADNFYRDIITDFGISANEAVSTMNAHEIVMDEIDNKRKSLSGVSLDEEMTEMLKFQHAYNASARVINAIDEMADQIISKMGLVGR